MSLLIYYYISKIIIYICYALLVYATYTIVYWLFDFGNKYGLKGPKSLPIFGNIFDYIKHGFLACDMEFGKKYGGIYRTLIGQSEMLVISDEALLRQILAKDSSSFSDRPIVYGLSKLMRQNLAQLQGNDWRRVRSLLSPAFTPSKMKKISPMIQSSVDKMIKRIENMYNEDINAKELFGSLTMTSIAKTMFGIEIDVSKNREHAFIQHVKKLFGITISKVSFVVMSIFPQLLKLIGYLYPDGFLAPDSEIYLKKCVTQAIKQRRETKTGYGDLLSLMMEAHEEVSDEPTREPNTSTSSNALTEEELMAQCVAFLFAGYETTSSALTFCTYYLSKNPSIQEKIFEELLFHLSGKKEISYDILGKLTLMDQCLNETLRICPPVSRIPKKCSNNTILTTSNGKEIHVKKGTEFIIPVYAIHHDENVWSNPEVFDIHRFDEEERNKHNSCSFLPFGMGIRNCVGMRYAVMEAKFALASLLQNYEILPSSGVLQNFSCDVFGNLLIESPILMKFKKR